MSNSSVTGWPHRLQPADATVLWVLGGAGLIVIGWGLVSALRALYPERRTLTVPEPRPSYTTHTLQTPDGFSFEVWRLAAPQPRARLLLLHGYFTNPNQVLLLAEGLRREGFDVLLFELRGHGRRPGPFTFGLREAEDAERVIAWAEQGDAGRPLPLGLLGFSMGGAIACQIASRLPQVRAIVTDSMFSRFFPVLRSHIRRRYHVPGVLFALVSWWSVQAVLRCRLGRRDPAVLAPTLKQPLLNIRCGHDQVVASSPGDEFMRRWAGPKTEWAVPAAIHVGAFAAVPKEYHARVLEFFQRVLA